MYIHFVRIILLLLFFFIYSKFFRSFIEKRSDWIYKINKIGISIIIYDQFIMLFSIYKNIILELNI